MDRNALRCRVHLPDRFVDFRAFLTGGGRAGEEIVSGIAMAGGSCSAAAVGSMAGSRFWQRPGLGSDSRGCLWNGCSTCCLYFLNQWMGGIGGEVLFQVRGYDH